MASNNIHKVFCHCAVVLYAIADLCLTTNASIGFPVYKSFEYPVVPLDTDSPICYIQQSNGSTLNLSQLCSQDESRTRLSPIDRQFLASYNKSLSVYQNAQTFVAPDIAKNQQSPIETAQAVCSALKSNVPLAQIMNEQYQRVLATEDKRNQQLALAESEIIDSLAVKFYCPEFAK